MKEEKLLHKCDRVMAFSYYALIYFLPFSTFFIEAFYSIAQITYFVKRGIFFYYHSKEVRGERIHISCFKKPLFFIKCFLPVNSFLNKSIGVFILVNFVTIFFSTHPFISVKTFFFKILQSCFSCFILIECINNFKRLKRFLFVFFLSTSLVGINGVTQLIRGYGFLRGNPVEHDGRIWSSFKHPNDFGSYLIIVVLLLLSFLLFSPIFAKERKDYEQKSREMKTIYSWFFLLIGFLLFILSLFCLGFTFSKGAWVGLMVSLLLLSFLAKKRFWAPLVIAMVFFLIFQPLLERIRNKESFIKPKTQTLQEIIKIVKEADLLREEDERSFDNKRNRVMTQQAVQLQSSEELTVGKKIKAQTEEKKWNEIQAIREKDVFVKNKEIIFRFISMVYIMPMANGRIDLWGSSAQIIKDYPVWGAGLGTFSRLAPEYGIKDGYYSHNGFLHMASEVGVIGLGSFLFIIFSLYQNTFKNLKLLNNRFYLSMTVGILVGLVGFFVHSLFDTNMYSIQLNTLMWMMIGLIVAVQKIDLTK